MFRHLLFLLLLGIVACKSPATLAKEEPKPAQPAPVAEKKPEPKKATVK